MNKLKSSIALILISTIGLQAQINFEKTTLEALKQKAKAENKLIMIDAYTTWCGPCKWMASNTFTNKTVGNFFNSKFVNAKIDMEKGEGLLIAKKYDVNVYPTILFINSNGKLIHRFAGAVDTMAFIQLGNDALTPEKQYATFHDKYLKGVKDEQFLLSYIYKSEEAGLSPKKAVDDYFKTQKEVNYINQTNWNVLRDYVNQKNNVQLKYLIKNKKAYEEKYTSDSINTKIKEVYGKEFKRMIYVKKFDAIAYNSLKKEFLGLALPDAEKTVLQNDLKLYEKTNKLDLYGKTAISYVEKYALNDANELNDISYNVYTLLDDKLVLIKAEEWAKIATNLEKNNPYLMDTYASLLFKNNKKQEALSIEKEAISIIKNNPDKFDISLLTDLEKNVETWSK